MKRFFLLVIAITIIAAPKISSTAVSNATMNEIMNFSAKGTAFTVIFTQDCDEFILTVFADENGEVYVEIMGKNGYTGSISFFVGLEAYMLYSTGLLFEWSSYVGQFTGETLELAVFLSPDFSGPMHFYTILIKP
ncbi:MAG: hypothetical protein FWE10_08795 [Rikenellaceae bacterium]|nr:hypothetical protein [Rikenellaceae bacterium]MCL2693376.1 hypothetical protein [Rikenellaceae bacterium]